MVTVACSVIGCPHRVLAGNSLCELHQPLGIREPGGDEPTGIILADGRVDVDVPLPRPESLTFRELRRANVDDRLRDCFHPLEDWNPAEWACAMTGEAGETANLCKKMRRGEIVPLDALRKELGDTAIYLDLLAARLGLTLEECVRHAFNEVSEKVGCDVRL